MTVGDPTRKRRGRWRRGRRPGSAVALDVSDAGAFAAFLDAAERDGPLDVMVNNAGVDWIGPFHEEPDDVTRREVEVNLLGTIYGSHWRCSGCSTRSRAYRQRRVGRGPGAASGQRGLLGDQARHRRAHRIPAPGVPRTRTALLARPAGPGGHRDARGPAAPAASSPHHSGRRGRCRRGGGSRRPLRGLGARLAGRLGQARQPAAPAGARAAHAPLGVGRIAGDVDREQRRDTTRACSVGLSGAPRQLSDRRRRPRARTACRA